MAALDPAERARRIAEHTATLRAWGRRLLPPLVEADIYSRCVGHDLRIQTYAGVYRGLNAKAYVAAVQRWSPLPPLPPLPHAAAPTTLPQTAAPAAEEEGP